MSIQLTIKATGLNLNATLKDDALGELIKLTQSYRDEQAAQVVAAPDAAGLTEAKPALVTAANEDEVKSHLKGYGSAELLNRVKCDSYPEKILLLAAWYEARGGNPGWRSADMDQTFAQAKERPPANFPREIKQAIKTGWIHTVTPRTYCVTRTGWNKVAEFLSK
jgi:hypothetical protein